jgi:CheY-like chemotaxis protein
MTTSRKILLVDDDASFVESNRDLLEAYGYAVFTACNGTEALAKAQEVRPDVMVLDVMMRTDTEGLDVARRVREMPELSNLRVVLVTGVTQALQLPHDLEADERWLPVDRVLEKPVDPGRLLGEIERVLGVTGSPLMGGKGIV